jgi:predicted ATPase/DNA-binding CsgD family transcriptional regulator
MGRPRRRIGNLPAESTTFVGRNVELAELKRTLATARLASLVGPGGVGKTRLAIRLAAQVGRGFRDGVWLVELAELREAELVPKAVMSALDVRDQATGDPSQLLFTYLHEKELMLVIDNCEHLIRPCASLVTGILAAAPRVKVLTTSREPLSAAGEYVHPVPPLELPEVDAAATVSRVLHNDAVQLFVERATAASGTFEVTEANKMPVAELCRRLDGLPLAIELAAVRTRALSAEQILDHLGDRFRLLTGGSPAALPRHQTLRAAIDWSYDLLTPGEQAVMRRLSVFAGGFTLEAAQSICAPRGMAASDLLDVLTSLINKSLVIKEQGERLARYRLHETIREYAGLKLREASEDALILERHARYYTSQCQQSMEEAWYRPLYWLEWMDAEIDNIRALLKRYLDTSRYKAGVEILAALMWFWLTRATNEGVIWLDVFLRHDDGETRDLARAHAVRGIIAAQLAELAKALDEFGKAQSLAREAGDIPTLVLALQGAATVANFAGDHAKAADLLNEARTSVVGCEVVEARAVLAQGLGIHAVFEGDLAGATERFVEAVDLFRSLGHLFGLAMTLENLGSALLANGDLVSARRYLEEALQLALSIDERTTQLYALDFFACQAEMSGDARLAARLFGAARAIQSQMGPNALVYPSPLVDEAKERAKASLGAVDFEAELLAGTRLTRQEAAALALGRTVEKQSKVQPNRPTATLPGREAQVAELVAQGLSNKEIGARLFISDRTVESHVRSLMNKLGFSSRAQIAGWIASAPTASRTFP